MSALIRKNKTLIDLVYVYLKKKKKKVLPYLLYMVNFNSATEASALINYNISQLGKCVCTIRTLQNKNLSGCHYHAFLITCFCYWIE